MLPADDQSVSVGYDKRSAGVPSENAAQSGMPALRLSYPTFLRAAEKI